MNVKEYISSGIIESYVLGLLPDTEMAAFEAACAQYPEIAAARNAFELALESQLLGDAKEPPQALKQRVIETLTHTTADNDLNQLEEETTPVRRMGAWKWLAAASLVLFAIAGYWAYTTNEKYRSAKEENLALQKQLQESTSQLDQMRNEADTMTHAGMKWAAMRNDDASQTYATVLWDTAGTRDVYLMINNLPQPATDKQYQLWALLNGQPINLGAIQVTQHHLLYRMKNVQNAQAFAITIEPAGSNAPTPSTQPIGMAKL